MTVAKPVIFLAVLGALFFSPGFGNAVVLGQAPNVSVSSARALQADTLLVKVIGESNSVIGTFGTQKLLFFRSQDGKDWVALVPISVKKLPGMYKLAITAAGKKPFKKSIVVGKKKFPVTKLQITPRQKKQGYSAKNIIKNIQSNAATSLNDILAMVTPTPYFTKPFTWPLASMKITGDYGDIRQSGGYKAQHLGADLQAAVGTPVYAVNDGKVVFAKNLPDYGNAIIIDHGLGIYSLYLHLSQFNVALGDMVKQGDTIALSGDTGYVLGPHLHFSVKVRDVSVNPILFVQATQNGW